MNIKEYLKEHLAGLLIEAGILAFIVIALTAFIIAPALRIEIVAVYAVGMLIVHVLDFKRESHFFNQINENLKSLDQKYLVHEIIDEPESIAEEKLLLILEEIDRSMLEHLNQYQRSIKSYREYVELWIHEIKIPMASVRLIAENSWEKQNPLLPEELNRMDTLVEQVLYYVRSESPEKDYLIKAIQLKDIVNEVISRNRTAFIYRHIALEMDGLNTKVYTDSKWMIFILNQILSNALKYLDKDPSIIKITVQTGENEVWLSVEDNGKGISASDLPLIFEKGFTGENGRDQSPSTGIGLYLCHELCSKLHHEIHVNSQKGKGCKVSIGFPSGSMTDIVSVETLQNCKPPS